MTSDARYAAVARARQGGFSAHVVPGAAQYAGAVSTEGTGLYFANNNAALISAPWSGTVEFYTLDILPGTSFEIIGGALGVRGGVNTSGSNDGLAEITWEYSVNTLSAPFTWECFCITGGLNYDLGGNDDGAVRFGFYESGFSGNVITFVLLRDFLDVSSSVDDEYYSEELPVSVAVGDTVHLCMMLNGSTAEFYVDGESVGTIAGGQFTGPSILNSQVTPGPSSQRRGGVGQIRLSQGLRYDTEGFTPPAGPLFTP